MDAILSLSCKEPACMDVILSLSCKEPACMDAILSLSCKEPACMDVILSLHARSLHAWMSSCPLHAWMSSYPPFPDCSPGNRGHRHDTVRPWIRRGEERGSSSERQGLSHYLLCFRKILGQVAHLIPLIIYTKIASDAKRLTPFLSALIELI